MSLSELGYQPMPWANGGGTTWEVARDPADPTAEFIWRISVAEIDGDGPFSNLPDIDRVFTLASSAPIELQVNGAVQRARFATPIRFCGEDAVSCTTAGAATALNVMTRRGLASAEVEIMEADHAREIDAGDHDAMLLMTLVGSTELRDHDGTRSLRPLQAATIGRRRVCVAVTHVAVVVSITLTRPN